MSTRDELAADLDFNSVPSFEPEFGQGRFFTPDIADALIAEGWRKKPSREELADEISGVVIGSGYYSTQIGRDAALNAADAILALMDRGLDG